MSAPTPLPPGWYPDPSGKAGKLYWDGREWHTAPPPTPLPPGWYPDPSGKAGKLYWDGQEWRTAPPPVPPSYFLQAKRRDQLRIHNKLRIEAEYQSLPGGAAQLQRSLTIRYNDQPIQNLYFVTVSLANDGPKDIRSADFENGAPLRIQLPGMIRALLPLDDPTVSTTGGQIHVSPGLLPKGKTFTINVIADIPGPHPDESGIAIVTPLANTVIVTKAHIRWSA
jgi:hypothetical protein